MRTRILVIPTDPHMAPAALARAIANGIPRRSGELPFVETLIPAVLPPSLPISACPPRVVARLKGLRAAAVEALGDLDVPGRVEIAPCRSIPALLQAARTPDTLILVGPAPWRLRRIARGIDPEFRTIPTHAPRRGPAAPAIGQPGPLRG